MATDKQIAANRLNALKSTGPRTAAGRAVSRFNNLKSGIDANAEIIRGEDPGALEALRASFHAEYEPATPMEAELVDAIVHFAWLRRRLRKAEAETWEGERKRMRGITGEDFTNGEVFVHHIGAFNRMQRRIDSTERNFHRNLQELQKLQAARRTAEAAVEPEPAPQPEAPDPGQPFAPEPIGFVPQPTAPAPLAIESVRPFPVPNPEVLQR